MMKSYSPTCGARKSCLTKFTCSTPASIAPDSRNRTGSESMAVMSGIGDPVRLHHRRTPSTNAPEPQPGSRSFDPAVGEPAWKSFSTIRSTSTGGVRTKPFTAAPWIEVVFPDNIPKPVAMR
jgi:hypothetical protein